MDHDDRRPEERHARRPRGQRALRLLASAGIASPADLLALALELAAEVAQIQLAAVGQDRTLVESKTSATDLVTETDKAAEAHILDRLADVRPGDGVIGEEGADRAGTSGIVWVVDPIDGTTNFFYGYPAYCVSIGVEVDGVPTVGVVHDAWKQEVFSAIAGSGASVSSPHGTRRLAVRPAGPALEHALVGTGFGYGADRRAVQASILATVLPRVRDVRRAGSAALDLCSVAAGRLDAYYERGLQHWDHAAGALIAREAGAVVGSFEGGPLSNDRTIVAARPDLDGPLRALLTEAGAGGPLA